MKTSEQTKNPSPSGEDAGTSLFQCLWEQQKFLLQRLIVVASIPSSITDRQVLGGYYEELHRRLQRRHQGDVITGMLLLYPTCMLYLVECSSDTLVSVLQGLRDMQVPERRVIKQARILVVSHNIPSRLFQHWTTKLISLPARVLWGSSADEPTEKHVADIVKLLLRLGDHLLKATRDSEIPAESVLDEVPELTVPENLLMHLLDRQELLSPQQYLDTYHSPINVSMDTGHVFRSSQTNKV